MDNGPEKEPSGLDGRANAEADAASQVEDPGADAAGNAAAADGDSRDGGDGSGDSASGDGSDGSDGSAADRADGTRVRSVSGVSTIGLGGTEADESALRLLFHTAVQDLEPSEDALQHLRTAVPNRRARKRQAVVGAVAAVLLCGTAIPAFIHVANSGGTSNGRSVNAGHDETQGGTGPGTDSAGTEKQSGQPTDDDPSGDGDPSSTLSPGDEAASGAASNGTDDSTGPADSFAVDSPTCEPSQLAVTVAEAGPPEANGTVYGTFRVSNVSSSDCAVSGAGAIGFKAGGAADASKINVVEHASGDAATQLPAPSQQTTTLLLAPATAYEVKFAWVPSDTCPTQNESPDPSQSTDGPAGGGGENNGAVGGSDGGTGPGPVTDPGAGTGGGSGGGTANTAAVTSQLGGRDDGGTEPGTVMVEHSAAPGEPIAEAEIPNACAGTIYKTGVLDAS
ncbi:hypothetical protein [Streptomyces sp. AcH 505]|uniref:hypothetical protein n=1 Tax=Streptomyces sp. AcH 505 TaxID=352211 RepID=UPI000AFDC394